MVPALAIGALSIGALAPSLAHAQAAAASSDAVVAPAPPRLVEVRLALSATASKQLVEQRLRRLLEIELGDVAVLAPAPTGPLGDHVAYVWVDLTGPSTAAIEVRVGGRAVERREIADSELTGDIVARVIAIATAEMVREQMKPVRVPKKPAPPKPPSPEEIEAASQRADAVTVDARAAGAFVPSAGATMFGPSVDLGFRRYGIGAHLTTGFFTGPTSFGSARWFEVGAGASYRFWATPSVRLVGEIGASVAAVRVAGTHLLSDYQTRLLPEYDTWSARAGGSVGLEWRATEPVWLTLAVGPSAILRPFGVTEGAPPDGSDQAVGARTTSFEGFFVGATIGVLFEQRAPVHVKALQTNGNGSP